MPEGNYKITTFGKDAGACCRREKTARFAIPVAVVAVEKIGPTVAAILVLGDSFRPSEL